MNADPALSPDPRFDAEGDEIVHQLFSDDDLCMSPEEYAARHAHEWGCFGLDRCRFRDPALGEWIRRFANIFESIEELERCRSRFLSPEELVAVKIAESEEF